MFARGLALLLLVITFVSPLLHTHPSAAPHTSSISSAACPSCEIESTVSTGAIHGAPLPARAVDALIVLNPDQQDQLLTGAFISLLGRSPPIPLA